MDLVALFNEVTNLVKPAFAEKSHAKSLEDNLASLGFDSLDHLMFAVYFGEIYGIPEETMKLMRPKTVKDFFDFIEANKTNNPQSVEEALGMIK